MATVKVTSQGIERLSAKISRAVNFLGAAGIRSVLRSAADDLEVEFRKRIDSFTPGDVPDLAESTKKQKAARGSIYPILRRTDRMYDALTCKVYYVNGEWSIRLSFPGSSEKGIALSQIAQYHLDGTTKMPARNFTKISDHWKRNLIGQIRSQLFRR